MKHSTSLRILLIATLTSVLVPACGSSDSTPQTVEPGADAAVGIQAGPSCAAMSGQECAGASCCESLLLPGGTFPMGRSDNGTDACPSYGPVCWDSDKPEHDATVSAFYLDRFEVTVGRFRAFVDQYDGTPPAQDAGAHPLIAASGWKSAWNGFLPVSKEEMIAALNPTTNTCPEHKTWRDAPGGTEDRPMNCVQWYASFAFCIWDGGRLPTEAEWEYAATGAEENRLYAWGNTQPDPTLSEINANDVGAVGTHPAGIGRFGHLDLGGSVAEWALDSYDAQWYSGAGNVCKDCANLAKTDGPSFRGGSFADEGSELRSSMRGYTYPHNGFIGVGVRCARSK